MNTTDFERSFAQFYGNVVSPKAAALAEFRRRFSEKVVTDGATEWRYRVIGTASPVLLAIPGGELVNDLGFEFALAISGCCRIVYPAYPRVSSIEELASGLRTILDAEKIKQVAILGASFGGAVAQVFVRRYPERISHLILSGSVFANLQLDSTSAAVACYNRALTPFHAWGAERNRRG